MGDAGILAWDQKYLHNLWRPVLGVREHDPSMGPATATAAAFDSDCDPSWLPLGAPASNSTDANFTPPFPAYPSGHATFGAAAFHTVRLFYGVPALNRANDTCSQTRLSLKSVTALRATTRAWSAHAMHAASRAACGK